MKISGRKDNAVKLARMPAKPIRAVTLSVGSRYLALKLGSRVVTLQWSRLG